MVTIRHPNRQQVFLVPSTISQSFHQQCATERACLQIERYRQDAQAMTNIAFDHRPMAIYDQD